MSEILNNYLDKNIATNSNPAVFKAAVSKPVQQQYPNIAPLKKDTVSFGNSEQTRQENSSKGLKWGIGLGLAALAGVGIYIATKGKGSPKLEKNISEILKEKLVATDFSKNIKYQPATTIEEARKFTVDILKIKEVDQSIPLDVLNKLNSE